MRLDGLCLGFSLPLQPKKRFFQALTDRLFGNGLDKIACSAGIESLLHIIVFGRRGQHNKSRRIEGAESAKSLQDLHPGRTRYILVKEYDIERLPVFISFMKRVASRVTVRHRNHLRDVHLTHGLHDDLLGQHVIIDDKDFKTADIRHICGYTRL